MAQRDLITFDQVADNMLGGTITEVQTGEVYRDDVSDIVPVLRLKVEHHEAPSVMVEAAIRRDSALICDPVPQDSHGNIRLDDAEPAAAIPQDSPGKTKLQARADLHTCQTIGRHAIDCEHGVTIEAVAGRITIYCDHCGLVQPLAATIIEVD